MSNFKYEVRMCQKIIQTLNWNPLNHCFTDCHSVGIPSSECSLKLKREFEKQGKHPIANAGFIDDSGQFIGK